MPHFVAPGVRGQAKTCLYSEKFCFVATRFSFSHITREYYRRKLPHWHPEDGWLFITFRLHGSLPKAMLLPALGLSAGRAFLDWDRVLDGMASGPQWLGDSRIAQLVCDVILEAGGSRGLCDLVAFVVMSNHVHLLVRPSVPLARLTHWIKGTSAFRANQILGLTGHGFWQHESYDHCVRSSGEFAKIARYIEENPVKAGLVRSESQWEWSSANQNVATRFSLSPIRP